MFDLSACHVERTPQQDYLVRWHSFHPGQKIAIYMSDSPDRFYEDGDPGTPLLYATGSEALLHNPEKGVRHYFYLESEGGEGVILAERKLPVEGTPNLRDLGGYETEEGRRLRWGSIVG